MTAVAAEGVEKEALHRRCCSRWSPNAELNRGASLNEPAGQAAFHQQLPPPLQRNICSNRSEKKKKGHWYK